MLTRRDGLRPNPANPQRFFDSRAQVAGADARPPELSSLPAAGPLRRAERAASATGLSIHHSARSLILSQPRLPVGRFTGSSSPNPCVLGGRVSQIPIDFDGGKPEVPQPADPGQMRYGERADHRQPLPVAVAEPDATARLAQADRHRFVAPNEAQCWTCLGAC